MKTKTKSKKSGKISIIKRVLINQQKPIDEHGYPIPRSEICFRCEEKFWLTFVSLKQHYAQRNFWFYWTEQEEDKEKFVCSPCLKDIYTQTQEREFYLSNIKNIRKKRMLSSYSCSNSI